MIRCLRKIYLSVPVRRSVEAILAHRPDPANSPNTRVAGAAMHKSSYGRVNSGTGTFESIPECR
jgi:hypothetical protein